MLEKGDKPGEIEKGITYAEIMSYQKRGGVIGFQIQWQFLCLLV